MCFHPSTLSFAATRKELAMHCYCTERSLKKYLLSRQEKNVLRIAPYEGKNMNLYSLRVDALLDMTPPLADPTIDF